MERYCKHLLVGLRLNLFKTQQNLFHPVLSYIRLCFVLPRRYYNVIYAGEEGQAAFQRLDMSKVRSLLELSDICSIYCVRISQILTVNILFYSVRHEEQSTQVSVITTGRRKLEQISDQGVDVHTEEQQIIRGNHFYHITTAHSGLHSNEFSDERPNNVIDELSTSSSSPHTNPKQVIGEERENAHCNTLLCTGRTLQPTNSPSPSFSGLQELVPNHLPDSLTLYHRCKLEAPESDSWSCCANMHRGSWHYNNYAPKEFYASSIQESLTLQRFGQMQELVLNNHPITFSYTCTNTCYMLTELQRRELYYKPFYSYAPAE